MLYDTFYMVQYKRFLVSEMFYFFFFDKVTLRRLRYVRTRDQVTTRTQMSKM